MAKINPTRGKAAAREMSMMEREAKMKVGKTVAIKPPPAPKAPPLSSKTQDNYTHHTSPVKGPQPTPVEPNTVSSKAKVKIRKLPDTPMAKYKHTDD